MRTKKFVVGAALLLCALSYASAAAVSFQIIQHDPNQSEIRSSSYVIENTLFDFFFEKGCIVTNSPTAVSASSSEDQGIYYRSLDEASEGGCTHFIVITVDYDTSRSTNPVALILSNITSIGWTLFDVKSGAAIAQGSKDVGTVSARQDNENGIRSFMRLVASDMYAALRKK